MTAGSCLLLLAVSGCGAAATSPLSLEVHYSADGAKLPQADSLSAVRVGVARFRDLRPYPPNDIHAPSYLAHDQAYDVGMTWNGRTFTPAAEVIQALLVKELQSAGLNADVVDAVVEVGDVQTARAAGQREHFDVVLGGSIREFEYNKAGSTTGDPAVALEVALFDVMGGKALWRALLEERHHSDAEANAQNRVDEVFSRSFPIVARDLVGKVADQLGLLIATATQEAAKAPAVESQPQPSLAEQPPPAVAAPTRRGRKRVHQP